MDDQAIPAGESSALDLGAELAIRTGALGDYFALPEPGSGDWQGMSALIRPATVVEFVDRTRAAIAASADCDTQDIPIRVAASSFQLGVAARLLSPPIGAATCFSAVPLITADAVTWEMNGHSPRFAMTDPEWITAQSAQTAAAAISRSVVATILGPLNEMLRSVTALSTQVTWGNVMSAANGAVTVMAMSRPERESRGRSLVAALMNTGQLAGSGGFVHGRFMRRSCCLFYLSPGSGLCGDCVLNVATSLQRPPR